MTFQQVVDEWMVDLTGNVTGLQNVVQHKYAPWSVEQGLGTVGERHLAIWPQGEPEVVSPATATVSGGDDLAAQTYIILCWEDASLDSARLQDDEAAASAWLTLGQDIRDRLYVADNLQTGGVDMTRYAGMEFDMRAGKRIVSVRFNTRQFYSFT